MTDNPFEHLPEQLDAAAGPLKRMAAITAQIPLSAIPADAGCHCLCSIYEPHQCEGWRYETLARIVPSEKVFGMQPPPVKVPVCRSCHDVKVRRA